VARNLTGLVSYFVDMALGIGLGVGVTLLSGKLPHKESTGEFVALNLTGLVCYFVDMASGISCCAGRAWVSSWPSIF